MKKTLFRPWLTVSGVELPTLELKEISKEWGEETWGSYLNWFQSGNSEKLVSQKVYEKISKELEINVFDNFGYNTCPALQSYCERLLTILPNHQQVILRSIFLEGKSQSQVAFEINRTKTCVSQNKYKALTTLKREHDGEQLYARQYMRGAKDFSSKIENSAWSEKLSNPARDPRCYHVADHHKELLNHKCPELREVFRDLSERSCQIMYLKFWCDLTHVRIARKCSVGLNTVDSLIEATVFKVKSKVAENLNSDRVAGQAAFFIKGE